MTNQPVRSQYGVGLSTANEKELVIRQRMYQASGSARGIILLHGHGADAMTWQVGTGIGDFAQSLAAAGFLIQSIDAGGPSAWSNSSSMTAITNAYNRLVGSLGAASGKVGIMGWSMGGLAGLNWMKRNPTLVGGAWLWAPCTDLDWAHRTSGYTPAYSYFTAGSSYQAEIDTAYGGNYNTNAIGYKVYDEPASWRAVCPIKIAHATDDTTVPYAQSSSFVANVNDALVSMRSPDVTGGHTGLFNNVETSEVVSFFESATWN
jgi:alpha-beta hydrolase superfamily lysophospholipase